MAASLSRRRALSLLGAAAAGLVLAGPGWGQSAQELATTGHGLLEQGKLAEAVAVLSEAARLDPANAWIWNLLGRAWLHSGDPRRARESFQSALRADAQDGYAAMMLESLSQHPDVAAPGTAKPARSRRLSPLEEQARGEREQFIRTGQPGARWGLMILDPGHGGADPGMRGPDGLAEKDVTLDLARHLAAALSDRGCRTVLTRDSDYGVPLWARAAMSAVFGADLFVSLHATAAGTGAVGLGLVSFGREPTNPLTKEIAELENGVVRFERSRVPVAGPPDLQRFLTGWRGGRLVAQSRAEAERAAGALAVPSPLSGAVPLVAPLDVLSRCSCPALMVQAGSLTSPAEAKALADTNFRRDLAQALAGALT